MADKELSLTEIQDWMQGMLVQHMPVSGSGVTTAEMVNDSRRLSASQHLTIYRQSYIARLRGCMKNQFKVLAYALGEPLFEAFADQYLDENPSGSYTLNGLGEKFPAFLAATRPDAENEQKEDWPDFMIELAAFEYALSTIFDMPGTEGNVPGKDIPDDLLLASPTLHLFGHRFPICRYYLDFNAGLSPELPFLEQSYAAVSRQDYKLGLFSIGADQHYFLSQVKAGACIAEAKDKVIASFNIDRESLERVWPVWRKNFVASGFFVRM